MHWCLPVSNNLQTPPGHHQTSVTRHHCAPASRSLCPCCQSPPWQTRSAVRCRISSTRSSDTQGPTMCCCWFAATVDEARIVGDYAVHSHIEVVLDLRAIHGPDEQSQSPFMHQTDDARSHAGF